MALRLVQQQPARPDVFWIETSLGTKFLLPGHPGLSVGQLRHSVAETHAQLFPHHGRVVCSEISTAAPDTSSAGYLIPDDSSLAALLSEARIYLRANLTAEPASLVGPLLSASF